MRRPGFLLWRRLAQRRQAQRKMRTFGEPRPSFWQHLDAGVGRARSLALSTTLLLALGLLGWAIGEELARNPVIIEPLLVPESAAKAGWTGEALARQMRDRIREMYTSVSVTPRRDEYRFVHEQLDIVLPGGQVSIRTLVTIVRSVLKLPARRVTAEIVEIDEPQIQSACGVTPNPGDKRYLLVARLNPNGRSWPVCATTIAELPSKAVEGVMLDTNAFVLASYLSRTDAARANTVAHGILDDKSARPDHPWAHLLLGWLAEDEGKLDDAMAEYAEAAKTGGIAVAYADWGTVLVENLKRPAEAIGKFDEATKIDGSLAYAYNNWGYALYELKRPEEAIGKYEQAIRVDPNYVLAYNNWGNALSDLKRPEEAIGKYEQAIRVDPNDAMAYNNWGNALSELKGPEEAIGKYEQAIRLDPNNAWAYNNWGYALFKLKRPGEAIGKYEQAIRLDPNNALAYNNWGYALYELKRPEEAIGKYEQAIRLDPNYVLAYNNWGNALSDLKRPEEAIGKYEQAIRVDPNDAMAYNNWGNALRDLKRPEEAIGKYEQAIRLDPNYAYAYNNWALALDSLGRAKEAAAKRAIAECLFAARPVKSCTASGVATGGGGAAAPGK